MALMAGLGSLCSCIPYVLVLPVPGPLILNHPYQCKVLDHRALKPVEGVRVRVQVFKVGAKGDELARDYELRSDADGIFHIPRQTEPGVLVLWVAGLIWQEGFGKSIHRAGGASGPDTRIVLTLTREGFVPETLVCLERPRQKLKHPQPYVPNVIWLKEAP